MGKPASQGSAIAALVVSIVMLIPCCGLTLIPLILSIVGLVQVQSNPKASRMCTLIAWILIGVSVALGVIYLIISFAYGMSSPYYYY